jgi:hypothetical protein
MGYRILGVFGVLCGGAALANWFARGLHGSGAYTSGYSTGFFLGPCYSLSAAAIF